MSCRWRCAQVESEAKGLKKVTEALEARTQALTKQLEKQREDFAQRIFEAQQQVNEVRITKSAHL